MRLSYLFLLTASAITLGCASAKKATTYDFPKPVDTTDKPIEIQEKKIYAFPRAGIWASNKFDGARLNNFQQENDSVFTATFKPENTPINNSAWYAFKVWSDNDKAISIHLNYPDQKHRYHPKISRDGKNWTALADSLFDAEEVRLKLHLQSDTLWIAAQELMTSKQVRAWCNQLENQYSAVDHYGVGESRGGRTMNFMDITLDGPKKKPTILLLSRQHPPEVTGFLALQAFIDELLNHPQSDEFLQKYRVMVYPLLNPDGVDMGHWRHNMGGIDLNRDWAYYHQPETRQVANHIVSEVKKNKNEVILGLDFHSTWYDVFYTLPTGDFDTTIPGFKDQWLKQVEQSIGGDYQLNEKPSGLGAPVTKGWFFTQFGAEGVTYEIGDDTPRDFIKKKGKATAAELIELLLNESYD